MILSPTKWQSGSCLTTATVARFDPDLMEVFSIIPVSEYAKEIFANEEGVWAVSQTRPQPFTD